MAISSDGTQLTAAVYGGLIYTSTNGGANWAAAALPASNWRAVVASANGAELVAVVNGGVLYTEQSPAAAPATAAPPLQIQVAGGNIILSWLAGNPNLVLQQSTNLAGTAWVDVPATPVGTQGQNQLTLPVSTGQRLYRLKSP